MDPILAVPLLEIINKYFLIAFAFQTDIGQQSIKITGDHMQMQPQKNNSFIHVEKANSYSIESR